MSIISEYPLQFCMLHIVKVIAGNHFSDRFLVLMENILLQRVGGMLTTQHAYGMQLQVNKFLILCNIMVR